MSSVDLGPYLFLCERRNMPVSKDTTDCIGCPMRTYPSPCLQYDYYKKLKGRSALGYPGSLDHDPDTFILMDDIDPPDVVE